MKAYKTSLLAVLAAVSLTGCQDENASLTGEGQVMIKPTFSREVLVESRTESEELASQLGESLILWVSNEKGVVRQNNGIANLPEKLTLMSGAYLAEAWAGDSVSASWDKRWFKGSVPFEVSPGEVKPIKVPCKIQNVVISVNFDPEVDEVLKDYTLQVGHSKGVLTFDATKAATDKAYFMMPSKDKNISWVLSGTKTSDNSTIFNRANTIMNVQPGHEYIFNISCSNADNSEIGGAFLDIVIDDKVIEQNESVVLNIPPHIDVPVCVNDTYYATPGAVGKISAFISASSPMKSLYVYCEQLENIYGTGEYDFQQDFIGNGLSDSAIEELNAAGITWFNIDEDYKHLKISFDEIFTDKYFTNPDEQYVIRIVATDSDGLSKTKEITISFAEPPAPDVVVLEPVAPAAVTSNSVELTATIDANSFGEDIVGTFYYVEGSGVSRAEWQQATATLIGNTLTAKIDGLTAETTYSYYVSVMASNLEEPYTSDVMEFSTPQEGSEPVHAPQLPNAGFEDWSKDGKVVLICAEGADRYWDSGNHGSATLSKTVTDKDSEIKHGGNYSAKLQSQFVGVGKLGKFAAGNLFIGEYLNTDGTDGILGFGRPFDGRPVALHGWVKYTPGTVEYLETGAPADIVKGQPDKGIIYMALFDEHVDAEYDGRFPVIIKTKTKQLLNAYQDHQIAYGEKVFDEATPGDGMIEFTIPLEYFSDKTPSFIVLVASASKGGDYFSGGKSTMWIDDFELVY